MNSGICDVQIEESPWEEYMKKKNKAEVERLMRVLADELKKGKKR